MKKSRLVQIGAVALAAFLIAGCSASKGTVLRPAETVELSNVQTVSRLPTVANDVLWGVVQGLANATGAGKVFEPLIKIFKGLTGEQDDAPIQLAEIASRLSEIQAKLDVLSGQVSAIDTELRRANVARDQNTLAAYGSQITLFNRYFFDPYVRSAEGLVTALAGGDQRAIDDATRQFQNDRANYNREWDSGVAAFNGATFRVSGAVSSLAALIRPGQNSALFNYGRFLETKRYITRPDSVEMREIAQTMMSLQAQYAGFEALRWAPTDVALRNGDPSTYRGSQRTLDERQADFISLVRSEFTTLPALIPQDVVFDARTGNVWIPGGGAAQVTGAIEPERNRPRCPDTGTNVGGGCTFDAAGSDLVRTQLLDSENRRDPQAIAGATLRLSWNVATTAEVTRLYTSVGGSPGHNSDTGSSLNSFLASLNPGTPWARINGGGVESNSWPGIWTESMAARSIDCPYSTPGNGLRVISIFGWYRGRQGITSRTAVPGLPAETPVAPRQSGVRDSTAFFPTCRNAVPFDQNFSAGALLTQRAQPFATNFLGAGSGVNLRSNADLRAVDLSGFYLGVDGAGRGLDLSGANLSLASLKGANAVGVNLSGADLSNADLSGANLSGANLGFANLFGANLAGANLSGANLSGVNLTNVPITDANLSGAILEGAIIDGTSFANSDLSDVNFTEVTFCEGVKANTCAIDFRGADLSRANLSRQGLQGVVFAGADLSQANFEGSTLQDADLSGANLRGASMGSVNLSGANLTSAVLQRANAAFASGANVNFLNADLRNANFQNSALTGQTNFRGAMTEGADFTNATGSRPGPADPSTTTPVPLRPIR
ncbi:MAG: pentapeptide repeat-containing protein [Actinomycetes bacterium]